MDSLKLDSLSLKMSKKRSNVLAATADLIIENGYDATSLDTLCQRAGCSKSLIYELFGNKEGLLIALTEDVAVELSRALHAFHLQHLSVAEALHRYARLALDLLLAERHIAIVRALIASAWRHPELGAEYFAIGSRSALAALQQYIEGQIQQGALVVDDAQWAAREFQSSLLGDRILGRLLGAISAPSDADAQVQVEKTVKAFVTRYQVACDAGRSSADR